MARYGTYTVEFKRRLAEGHLSGGAGLSELAGEWPTTPDRRTYAAEIVGLERKVGQLTMELDLLKRGPTSAHRVRDASSSVVSGSKAAASEPGAGS